MVLACRLRVVMSLYSRRYNSSAAKKTVKKKTEKWERAGGGRAAF
jgi:hypothetical protein